MKKTILGIELGSTRIKSVLIDERANVLAQGEYEWKNELVDGFWSYSLDEVERGIQTSYADLIKNYGKILRRVDAIGISGMMHGYLAFDKEDNLLTPFRTWRNTNTVEASAELTELFSFHIPMRWSVAQYYQSVLEELPHIREVAHLTTLSGYVHYRLTGKRVLGVNDASGMFPIQGRTYHKGMLQKFNTLLCQKGLDISFETLLPEVLLAGERAGELTGEGARWLDVSGNLEQGIPLCPPEGDMGTGMVSTNSVSPKSGNVSAGTSANFTVVLEHELNHYYEKIDVIATPDGLPAALIHSNNCTTEINEWVNLFCEAIRLFCKDAPKDEIFSKLFLCSLESDEKTGGLLTYNFLAGEPLANTQSGAPMVVRVPDGVMNLSNFMQAQIYSAIAALALGMDILKEEGVVVDRVFAHGGFYKTPFVGQNATSAVLGAPVTVMATASEGGAWGVAILALYLTDNQKPFAEFVEELFSDSQKTEVMATEEQIKKFTFYMQKYREGLSAEKAFSELLETL